MEVLLTKVRSFVSTARRSCTFSFCRVSVHSVYSFFLLVTFKIARSLSPASSPRQAAVEKATPSYSHHLTTTSFRSPEPTASPQNSPADVAIDFDGNCVDGISRSFSSSSKAVPFFSMSAEKIYFTRQNIWHERNQL